jgi:hypothetical protein
MDSGFAAGRTSSGAHQDSIASLMSGSSAAAQPMPARAHMPVLNGGSSRANSLAGARSNPRDVRPAGAAGEVQSYSRGRAEMNLERKHRGRGPELNDQYDNYLDACEAHTFAKLHANLDKMERRAEREHVAFSGAAGITNEKRRERAEAKAEGRRDRSPARFQGTVASRFLSDNSVASLIQQPSHPSHGSGDVGGGEGGSFRLDRSCSPRGPRSSSPRHPAVPRLHAERVPGCDGIESAPSTDRSDRGYGGPYPYRGGAGPQVPRRAASPRGGRAPSPRRDASPRPPMPPRGRDASPFRQRGREAD